MSADKRQVTTDALETLGMLIGDSERRDAIHLAVEPAVAAHTLRPGEHVGFVDGGVGICDNPVGIVDPFLTTIVQAKQRFWLVVYPRQITSLRHVWTHPAFDGGNTIEFGMGAAQSGAVNPSEKWLRDYAASVRVDYHELLRRAKASVDKGEWWSEGGRFEGVWLPDEFWGHYELITGALVPSDKRESFFACSC